MVAPSEVQYEPPPMCESCGMLNYGITFASATNWWLGDSTCWNCKEETDVVWDLDKQQVMEHGTIVILTEDG